MVSWRRLAIDHDPPPCLKLEEKALVLYACELGYRSEATPIHQHQLRDSYCTLFDNQTGGVEIYQSMAEVENSRRLASASHRLSPTSSDKLL